MPKFMVCTAGFNVLELHAEDVMILRHMKKRQENHSEHGGVLSSQSQGKLIGGQLKGQKQDLHLDLLLER